MLSLSILTHISAIAAIVRYRSLGV